MKATLVFLVVFLIGLICLFQDDESAGSKTTEPIEETSLDQKGKNQLMVLSDAPFAKKFGQGQLSIHEELDLIQLAFQDYRSFVKKGYRRPIGDNRDFVEAMTGNNFSELLLFHRDTQGLIAVVSSLTGRVILMRFILCQRMPLKSAPPEKMESSGLKTTLSILRSQEES